MESGICLRHVTRETGTCSVCAMEAEIAVLREQYEKLRVDYSDTDSSLWAVFDEIDGAKPPDLSTVTDSCGVHNLVLKIREMKAKLAAAQEAAKQYGREQLFHACKDGKIKPYPGVLCSKGCYDTDFNVFALLSSQDVPRVREAFKLAFETMSHVNIDIDKDKGWFFDHPTLVEAMFKLGDAIKALAVVDDEIPGLAKQPSQFAHFLEMLALVEQDRDGRGFTLDRFECPKRLVVCHLEREVIGYQGPDTPARLAGKADGVVNATEDETESGAERPPSEIATRHLDHLL